MMQTGRERNKRSDKNISILIILLEKRPGKRIVWYEEDKNSAVQRRPGAVQPGIPGADRPVQGESVAAAAALLADSAPARLGRDHLA